jgi:type II restriction/modification system DNA methylase subunit YeeA
VTVWIGEIQWMKRHGFDVSRNPILNPLRMIECRDALLTEDGKEVAWPKVDVIIGNPPFLAGKRLLSALGQPYSA